MKYANNLNVFLKTYKYNYIYYYYDNWLYSYNLININHNLPFKFKSNVITYYVGFLKICMFFIKNVRIFIKKLVKKYLNLKKKVNLFVTFKKRNIMFNLTDITGASFYSTTLRREGYIGRRQLEYTSVESTTLVVKSVLKNLKVNQFGLYYKGWHRFRYAIHKVLFDTSSFLKIKFIKYIMKIPHNGCRLRKVKNRKSMSKWFVL